MYPISFKMIFAGSKQISIHQPNGGIPELTREPCMFEIGRHAVREFGLSETVSQKCAHRRMFLTLLPRYCLGKFCLDSPKRINANPYEIKRACTHCKHLGSDINGSGAARKLVTLCASLSPLETFDLGCLCGFVVDFSLAIKCFKGRQKKLQLEVVPYKPQPHSPPSSTPLPVLPGSLGSCARGALDKRRNRFKTEPLSGTPT